MAKTENENFKKLAGFRSSIYGFLAAIYRQEVSSDLLQQMKDQRFQEILSTLGIDLSNGFFKKPEKSLCLLPGNPRKNVSIHKLPIEKRIPARKEGKEDFMLVLPWALLLW